MEADMSHDGPEAVIIEPGKEDDLPGIVDILNHATMNSNATLATRPVSVADAGVV
jgi:L-amino acid N-acyltransferase YncA